MSFFGSVIGGFIGAELGSSGSSNTKEIIHEVETIEKKGVSASTSRLFYFEIPKDLFEKEFRDYEPSEDDFYNALDLEIEKDNLLYITIKIENNVECLSSIILLKKISTYMRTHNKRNSQTTKRLSFVKARD